MMRGTKRFAPSDSKSFTNDSQIQGKRIMGSIFDSQKAEQSQPQTMKAPQLDMQRAESSRQHVRALNTQFASWVQAQLQNNPDELWEDGIQDYLNHSSTIKEKFSDIVNWLKANSSNGEIKSAHGSQAALKTLESENKESDGRLSFPKPDAPVANSSSSFGASWNSGALFSKTTPFSFGLQPSVQTQNLVPLKTAAANDVQDAEDEVEQPSSPSVKKTEEKGVTVVHEVKCKLYVKSADPVDKDAWKDRGTGQLSIKCKEGVSKGTRESKPTILIRNDVGKILLNALLYQGIKTNLQKNSVVAIFHTSGDGDNDDVVARTFLIRTKTEEDRNKLAAAIQEHAPTA
ncbi:hypothetical protein AABB24_014870 [Solanum stoloniferum]|uniref:RanBD1 domain-containing protein n=2 Tax=Solanum TaxID=4107 RepID=A0AAF0UD20_SOLVR|nr:uncharacterized protein LOC125826903 isoform X3 [Solanum verrucosum]WMV43793.1 hypothetical protein MTR67_037178 [Solanum verrucosum]